MKFASRLLFIILTVLATTWSPAPRESQGQTVPPRPIRVSLDFTEVDLPVFVRFISELTGKNFVLDEKAVGKITVFSPAKVSVDQAYAMFLAALEVRRLTAIPKGDIIQIVPMNELPYERGVYVHKLKHANAPDTATVLTNLVARSLNPPPAPGGRPALRPLTEFEGPVQVFADKGTNSLLISSTKSDHERLLPVIQSLDTRRRQVFVEAVIMEVSVDRLRRLGTNPIEAIGVGKSGSLQGIVGVNRAPEDITSLAQTLSGVATGAVTVLNTVNVRAFLQLLMSQTDTNILSTPQVLASDNQKAKIVVGENRPFPTGQAQGITGGTQVTIERKDVGVTLELTPQVLENDLIRLDVRQEITAINENVSQTIGQGLASVPVGPTTTKRSMETIAIAKDQQTLVIGGLIRDNFVLNVQKVPLLGDIPLLGWLFKSESKATEKLNLLVFLTPHLIRDETDMAGLEVRKGSEVHQLQRENQIVDPTAVKRATEDLIRSESQPTTGGTEPVLPTK